MATIQQWKNDLLWWRQRRRSLPYSSIRSKSFAASLITKSIKAGARRRSSGSMLTASQASWSSRDIKCTLKSATKAVIEMKRAMASPGSPTVSLQSWNHSPISCSRISQLYRILTWCRLLLRAYLTRPRSTWWALRYLSHFRQEALCSAVKPSVRSTSLREKRLALLQSLSWINRVKQTLKWIANRST